MDLLEFVKDFKDWNLETYGPGERTKGHIDHITKELVEIESDPTDTLEWVDVILLAMSGALRHGYTPEELVAAIEAKHAKNKARQWPDWRTADPNKAIEHVKGIND